MWVRLQLQVTTDASSVGHGHRVQSPKQGSKDRVVAGFNPGLRHNPAMTIAARHLIKLTAQPSGAADTDHPKPERLIHGKPLRETWNLVQADLPAGEVFCGVWRCETGRWRVAMGPTERELFTVITGCCRVHDRTGGFEQVGPGEGLYIPPGFEGEFEVLETLTKTYMICE